jgi:hypothetical protein
MGEQIIEITGFMVEGRTFERSARERNLLNSTYSGGCVYVLWEEGRR